MIGMISSRSSANCSAMATYEICFGSFISFPLIEFADGLYHIILLLFAEVLIDRESDHFAGMPVGHREVARLVAELTQTFLLIEGDRVMDLGLDSLSQAEFQQAVPIFGEDDIKQKNVANFGLSGRNADLRYCRQSRVVVAGAFNASGNDILGPGQHPRTDYGLQGIQPGVAAHDLDFIAGLEAVIAQQTELAVHLIVVGDGYTGVAPYVDQFQGVRGNAAGFSPRSCPLAVMLSEYGLAGVFDH